MLDSKEDKTKEEKEGKDKDALFVKEGK